MAEHIDRKAKRAEAKALLSEANINSRSMAAFYLMLVFATGVISLLAPETGFLAMFVSLLTQMITLVLGRGFTLYLMAVRRGEERSYADLFNAFSFAGKVVALGLLRYAIIILCLSFFIVPGIIVYYRYRFAFFNLLENPSLGVLDALRLSARQTQGYKMQLFGLDLYYLPWIVLSSVVDLFVSASVLFPGFPGSELLNSIPAVIALNLFSLLVMLFFLPEYRCTELGYYETARGSSGAEPGALPPAPEQDGQDPFL